MCLWGFLKKSFSTAVIRQNQKSVVLTIRQKIERVNHYDLEQAFFASVLDPIFGTYYPARLLDADACSHLTQSGVESVALSENKVEVDCLLFPSELGPNLLL